VTLAADPLFIDPLENSVILKIKVISSASGDGDRHQFLLSYVCNGTVAIDAGCIGFMTPLEDQSRIKHVFLTHSHLDHTASLPIFLDNVYVAGPECPKVYAHPATLESLRTDFFNERLWPDLVRLSSDESPFLQMLPVTDSQATTVDGLTITPVELRHVVPTFAYTVILHCGAKQQTFPARHGSPPTIGSGRPYRAANSRHTRFESSLPGKSVRPAFPVRYGSARWNPVAKTKMPPASTDQRRRTARRVDAEIVPGKWTWSQTPANVQSGDAQTSRSWLPVASDRTSRIVTGPHTTTSRNRDSSVR
jgi:hypothetical protein